MRKLGAVVLVVVGLLSIMQAIASIAFLPTLLSAASQSGVSHGLAKLYTGFAVIALILGVILGVVLIAWRRDLAARLFDDDGCVVTIDAPVLLRVGIVLVGLILAAEALPAALDAVASTLLQDDLVAGSSGWLVWLSGLGNPLLRLAVGLAMVWSARPLAAMLVRPARPAKTVASQSSLCACPACGAPYDPADYQQGIERLCERCASPLGGKEEA